ncbi:accessory Sec system S-layer assembly protein [Bhargavaea ginsengi]|uniref:accessory Sec system S-layer assembly protein n=1 Tax=Bhargavaea ginsengi TaxID=426757 RepID=UPI002041DFED|nr:accessory Sec system S-layer assembly protein [Bhargavaea ginsengi]MCM3088111.1 accessory Sec system S-layer assembly protein [Bhargavaea ginsengi]
MNLFSRFKRTERKGADSSVSSEELTDIQPSGDAGELVDTALSLHPEWNVPQEQEYVLRFLANDLDPLKPNQLSLAGIDIDVDERSGDWLVKAFFRSSVSKPVQMGPVELLLVTEDGKLAASKEFDMRELGEIGPASARPWVFVFSRNEQFLKEAPESAWTLNFNVQSLMPHRLALKPEWEQSLNDTQKEALQQVVDSLPKLKPQELNMTGFQALIQDDGKMAVALLIRNGYSRRINLEQLPLEVIDGAGDLVAKGTFQLPPLEVDANTTTPWTFIFPADSVKKPDADLSRWTARVPR